MEDYGDFGPKMLGNISRFHYAPMFMNIYRVGKKLSALSGIFGAE